MTMVEGGMGSNSPFGRGRGRGALPPEVTAAVDPADIGQDMKYTRDINGTRSMGEHKWTLDGYEWWHMLSTES